MFAQNSKATRSKTEFKQEVKSSPAAVRPDPVAGLAPVQYQNWVSSVSIKTTSESKSKVVPDLKAILAQVESEVPKCSLYNVLAVAEHLRIFKSYAESKDEKDKPEVSTNVMEACLYFAWYLNIHPSLSHGFSVATKPLREKFNVKNKSFKIFTHKVNTVVGSFLTARERARFGSVSAHQEFRLFSKKDREKYGIPINFQAKTECLWQELDQESNFMFLDDENKLNTFEVNNPFLKIMRDGRVAEIDRFNKIVIYDDLELLEKRRQIYIFPFSGDTDDQIVSIDILLDQRLVVGKKNGTLELYTQTFEKRQAPLPYVGDNGRKTFELSTRKLEKVQMPVPVEPILKPAEEFVLCDTSVTVLSTGEIVSNHKVKEVLGKRKENYSFCHLVTNPLTGKTVRLKTPEDVSNVVDLRYGQFAMIFGANDAEQQIVIYNLHGCTVMKKINIDLGSELERRSFFSKPKLYVRGGTLIAYSDGVINYFHFPACTSNAKLDDKPTKTNSGRPSP